MEKKKSPTASLLIILLKSKKLLAAVKVLKSVKLIKPLITFGTMFISLIVYGFSYGWIFGIGLVAMIFIHEMGHVIALKNKGFPTKAPVFIPMLGAVIFAPRGMDRDTEAYVGIGGPVLGTIGALIAWAIWALTPSHPEIWLIMSYIGLFLNLFNMIPMRPLDGGRVTQAVGKWFALVGFAALIWVTLMTKDPGLLLLWIIVLVDIDPIPLKQRIVISILVWVLMVVTILLGAGHQDHHWMYIFDIILGGLYMGMYAMPFFRGNWEEKKKFEETVREESGANRPALPTKVRVSWFIKYVLMTTLLIICTHFQSQEIAKMQKQKKEPPKSAPMKLSSVTPSKQTYLKILNGAPFRIFYCFIEQKRAGMNSGSLYILNCLKTAARCVPFRWCERAQFFWLLAVRYRQPDRCLCPP